MSIPMTRPHRTTRSAAIGRGLALAACLVVAAPVAGGTVTLSPVKDNTLIETADGSLSNGRGDGLYSGRNNGAAGTTRRRAVLSFDVAGSVPAGSTITGATLTLTLLHSSPNGFQTHAIHRLLEDWGEGTSSHSGGQGAPATPGDATWLHTYFDDELWSAPGGRYAAAPSASAPVGTVTGPVSWGPTAETIADVQGWLDDPGASAGWILLGDETMPGTVKKFASREWPMRDMRPTLTVEFETGACPGDVDGSGAVSFDDLLDVLSAWGTYEPCPPVAPADIDGDCEVGFEDLLVVLSTWGPCP
jgi:hypothetical protein